MKSYIIPFLILFASCTSRPIPKPGEIWRNYDDTIFNEGDVSIDRVDSGFVHYTFLRTPKGCLPYSQCDVAGFMQNSFKILDAGQGAVYDENGIVILDSAKKRGVALMKHIDDSMRIDTAGTIVKPIRDYIAPKTDTVAPGIQINPETVKKVAFEKGVMIAKPSEGEIWQTNDGKYHMMLRGKEIILIDAESFTRDQFDSAYRKGVRDGRRETRINNAGTVNIGQ